MWAHFSPLQLQNEEEACGLLLAAFSHGQPGTLLICSNLLVSAGEMKKLSRARREQILEDAGGSPRGTHSPGPVDNSKAAVKYVPKHLPSKPHRAITPPN